MGRPRTPSALLKRAGAFKKNPDRVREDLEGVGPFPSEAPGQLDETQRRAWHAIVESIDPVLLTGSDVLSVSIMAMLLAQFEQTAHRTLATELRAWFSQYYVSPAGRARLLGSKS